MKILLISNFAPSLIPFRGHLLRTLVDNGHRVAVAVPGPLGGLREQLASQAVTCHELSFARAGTNPLGELALIARITALLIRERPDLLLLYTIKPVLYGSLAAAAAGVARVACLIPGLGYVFGSGGGWRRRLMADGARLAYKAAFTGVERVFFLNPDDAAAFSHWNLVLGSRAVVLPGEGVDTTHYTPPDTAPEPCSFLLIARLLREKGIGIYAEAAKLLRRSHPQARCYLLGSLDPSPDGIAAHELQRWVDDGLLIHLGQEADVRPTIARAGVFVLPSYYREGLPRTILEAMAMAKPIITTDVPGCRETVRHGLNGLLIPPQDPRALAAAMARLADDPLLAQRMGEAGRRLCEQVFAVDLVNQRIIDELALARMTAGGSHGQ